jgi:hypothetical protein
MKKKKKKTKSEDTLTEEPLIVEVVEEIQKKSHYVNNKMFFDEMVDWKSKVKESKEVGDPIPPVTPYIGQCFMEIAENLAKKPNFMNYPFKDDMIGDGVENCLMYCSNFDPSKSNNPFSYFTQIIYYAFLRRIEREKKQAYVKFKLTEEMDDGTIHKWFKENYFEKNNEREALSELFQITENDIQKYEPKKRKKRSKNKS